jgi:hypothetical protein
VRHACEHMPAGRPRDRRRRLCVKSQSPAGTPPQARLQVLSCQSWRGSGRTSVWPDAARLCGELADESRSELPISETRRKIARPAVFGRRPRLAVVGRHEEAVEARSRRRQRRSYCPSPRRRYEQGQQDEQEFALSRPRSSRSKMHRRERPGGAPMAAPCGYHDANHRSRSDIIRRRRAAQAVARPRSRPTAAAAR